MATSDLVIEAPERQRPVVDFDERTWLTRHCRGDESAFPALMQAYRRAVYSYLVRAGVAEADRDDLFQSVFLKVHAAAASYDPTRPLAPWLFTIVANTVRNHFREQRASNALGPSDDPPEVVLRLEQRVRELHSALERQAGALPPRSATAEPDPELLDSLRSLGYLGEG